MVVAIMSLRSGPGGASWSMRCRRAVEKLRFDHLPRVTSSPAAGKRRPLPRERARGGGPGLAGPARRAGRQGGGLSVAAVDESSPRRAGYRRSAGTPRGEARRRELLDRVVDDLAVNGLVDFSLRRAARAAGTTHKVLLYHFDGADDLLQQAIAQLRQRRIGNALAMIAAGPEGQTLADRARAIWAALAAEESRVLDQAIGLMMYDPVRYAELGRDASQQYLPALLSICPPGWSGQRK